MVFENMNAIQRRLHNAACVLGADGDEHGLEQLQRDAIEEIQRLREEAFVGRSKETMEHPTTAEDVAFWAQLVLATVWSASEARWLAVPFIMMALSLRLPYWLRAWKRGRVA